MNVNATSNTSGTSGTSANNTNSVAGLSNIFMQVLVAELQNQDPTTAQDPTQFVSQMVGLNTLDQVSQINSLLQKDQTSTSTSSQG